MIAATWKNDTRVADDLTAYMDSFDTLVADAGERAYQRIAPDMLDELEYYPAPRPNQKYQRTYRLRDGLEIAFRREAGRFSVYVSNAVEYSKFVVGSLAQARAAAASFQAWMHKGRWPLAFETVGFWYEAWRELLLEEIQKDQLERFGTVSSSRRAYTR